MSRSPGALRHAAAHLLALALVLGCSGPEPHGGAGREGAPEPVAGHELVDDYLDRYFETFPTRATAAGRHDLDRELENLGPAARAAWVDFNRRTAETLWRALADPELDLELRLDFELLLRQAEEELFDHETLRVAERNPLYWTGLPANATIFLLVRDDRPAAERLAAAAARARKIPALTEQARAALGSEPAAIPPELCEMAARQAAGTAGFYGGGFVEAAGGEAELRELLAAAGAEAAAALEGLAGFLDSLCAEAAGSPRLGELYERSFRIATGIDRPVGEILEQAEASLEAKIAETAAYGGEVWEEVLPGSPAPAEEVEQIRRLFARIGEDRADSVEAYVADFRELIDASVEFVREHDLVTLPEPLTLHTDRSPSFFVGASVGGVYPAGPYAAEDAETLLFVPTPREGADAAQRAAFFRDFNHHFNVMITPHEIIPGHYLQLEYAARHPHEVRAIFPDGVYVEGWGTFCERLMLDRGWGTPLARLAHLKKQLENIARTIVDIRVHTDGMERREVLAFVQEEALQDAQFAANMWRRAITSSPQLTSYYLGYTQVQGLFEDVRAARGEDFRIKEFMDGMMELGPVPVRHYRRRMLGDGE